MTTKDEEDVMAKHKLIIQHDHAQTGLVEPTNEVLATCRCNHWSLTVAPDKEGNLSITREYMRHLLTPERNYL